VPAPLPERPFRIIIPRLNLLLRELDRRNRPVPGTAPDGNSQAMVLVERDSFHHPRPSVAEDHGLVGAVLWSAPHEVSPKSSIRHISVSIYGPNGRRIYFPGPKGPGWVR
jgi:hypothetical protein